MRDLLSKLCFTHVVFVCPKVSKKYGGTDNKNCTSILYQIDAEYAKLESIMLSFLSFVLIYQYRAIQKGVEFDLPAIWARKGVNIANLIIFDDVNNKTLAPVYNIHNAAEVETAAHRN